MFVEFMQYPTHTFNIQEYRSYIGYEFNPPKWTSNGNILCSGTCDLRSIRPKDQQVFTWVDHFINMGKKCSIIDQIAPLHILKKYIFFYLENVSKPKFVNLVIPIYCDIIYFDDRTFTIGKNSTKALHYMFIKKIISKEKYDEGVNIIRKCNLIDRTAVIQYTIDNIIELEKFCKKQNIIFSYTTNATKTSNLFYRELINDITRHTKSYVGWVENQDSQPDSSIGPKTQFLIFETFSKFMKNYD
jgi:hypothetical protein